MLRKRLLLLIMVDATTPDFWGNSYSPEQWEDGNALITADLCDKNDAVQSVDLVAWRRLSSGNVAIYVPSDYIETNDNALYY